MCVGQDPQDGFEATIAELELDAPKLGLTIDEAGVRVERELTVGAAKPADHGIPSALVTDDG